MSPLPGSSASPTDCPRAKGYLKHDSKKQVDRVLIITGKLPSCTVADAKKKGMEKVQSLQRQIIPLRFPAS